MMLAARARHGRRRRQEDHHQHRRRRDQGGRHLRRRDSSAKTKLRRFLVGPKECEITGIAETPDGKALFVNIQHPGEDDRGRQLRDRQLPAATGRTAAGARPRSATIVITKNDGGEIGGGLA